MTTFIISAVISTIALLIMANRRFETLFLIITIMLAPILPLVLEWNIPDWLAAIYAGLYVASALTLNIIDWRHWTSS